MTNPDLVNKFPLPTISDGGKKALDQLLKNTEEEGKVPPVFFAACNAQDILYENQQGWVEKDKPERGRINEDTSQSTGFHPDASTDDGYLLQPFTYSRCPS